MSGFLEDINKRLDSRKQGHEDKDEEQKKREQTASDVVKKKTGKPPSNIARVIGIRLEMDWHLRLSDLVAAHNATSKKEVAKQALKIGIAAMEDKLRQSEYKPNRSIHGGDKEE